MKGESKMSVLVPPTPSLGSMLSEARTYMELAPWTVLYPGLALALLVGGKLFARMKRSLGASERIRQVLAKGVAADGVLDEDDIGLDQVDDGATRASVRRLLEAEVAVLGSAARLAGLDDADTEEWWVVGDPCD